MRVVVRVRPSPSDCNDAEGRLFRAVGWVPCRTRALLKKNVITRTRGFVPHLRRESHAPVRGLPYRLHGRRACEGSVSLCTVSVGLKQFQMSPEMRPGDEARKRSDVRVRQKRQFRGARQPSRTQPIEIGATSSSKPIYIREPLNRHESQPLISKCRFIWVRTPLYSHTQPLCINSSSASPHLASKRK